MYNSKILREMLQQYFLIGNSAARAGNMLNNVSEIGQDGNVTSNELNVGPVFLYLFLRIYPEPSLIANFSCGVT